MKVGVQTFHRRIEFLQLAALLLLVVAAPTVGDIGSCGAKPTDLDVPAFFKKKAALDCDRCRECGITSITCARACDPTLTPTAFPEGCFPIAHDGEVCLHALEATNCQGYESFVTDQGATIPTECNFCPIEGAP
jgi:hypothetical protein